MVCAEQAERAFDLNMMGWGAVVLVGEANNELDLRLVAWEVGAR